MTFDTSTIIWRKHNRSRAVQVGALLVLLSALLGCEHQPPTIALIPEEPDDLWEPAHIAATNAARGSGFDLYWNGPTRRHDVQRQILILDHAIQKGVQGILIAPAQPLALMTPVQRAVSKGLPTVILGSPLPLPATGTLSYVLNDEDEEGKLAARRLGERLHGRGSVAVLGVHPGSASLFLRLRAFENALAVEFPGVTITSARMGSADEAEAEQTARELLNSEPNIDAIFALSAVATLGAFRALRDEQNSKVLLVGCDQQYDLLYYLSLGKIDSIVAENTYEMGELGMKIVIAKKRGENPSQVIKVKPVLITLENMSAPEFVPILIHDWRPMP
jgi:ribose transport system substrate-binding protein